MIDHVYNTSYLKAFQHILHDLEMKRFDFQVFSFANLKVVRNFVINTFFQLSGNNFTEIKQRKT